MLGILQFKAIRDKLFNYKPIIAPTIREVQSAVRICKNCQHFDFYLGVGPARCRKFTEPNVNYTIDGTGEPNINKLCVIARNPDFNYCGAEGVYYEDKS